MKLPGATVYRFDMNDTVLAMALAHRLHGTEEAVRRAAGRCRDRVRPQIRPLISQLMRHPKIMKWLDRMMAEI